MEIKKINSKLSFEAEGQQKCPHGKDTLNTSCTTDCTTVNWYQYDSIMRAIAPYLFYKCYSVTSYTCSWSHRL